MDRCNKSDGPRSLRVVPILPHTIHACSLSHSQATKKRGERNGGVETCETFGHLVGLGLSLFSFQLDPLIFFIAREKNSRDRNPFGAFM
ncbi:hypothetical protein IE53DRAFT_209506 [Violaceomyces palustris]|uniref:Uncharacterized protein n=1 Tax=Violaceomyces palustris TaxID=1673888 RepID=A0ACD0NQU5_9BASI|nr:hypothetical protein IE53DRAFT_209506 [Violaceomyces palustris]